MSDTKNINVHKLTSNLISSFKNKEIFDKMLKKYQTNKAGFLKLLLREQCLLSKKNFEGYYNPERIANFFNSIRYLYKRQDIEKCIDVLKKESEKSRVHSYKDLNHFLYSFLEQIREQIEKFEPRHLSNTFNGLAQLGITRKDLENATEKQLIPFLTPVMEQIQAQIGNFKPITLSNTFNGLAQLGITREDLENATEKQLIHFLTPVMEQIQEQIGNFKPITLSNTFNGLVTLFLYDYDKDNLEPREEEIFRQILLTIESISTKAKNIDIELATIETKNSFKKNLFFLNNILHAGLDIQGLDFLRENINQMKVHNHNSSRIEKLIFKLLKQKIKEDDIEKEAFISCTNNDIEYSHPFDFKFDYNGKTVFLEVDGPHHFCDTEEKIKTPKTIIRDRINQFILSKYPNSCYITVPDILIKKIGSNIFFNYLDEQIGLIEHSNTIDQITTPLDSSRQEFRAGGLNITFGEKSNFATITSSTRLKIERSNETAKNPLLIVTPKPRAPEQNATPSGSSTRLKIERSNETAKKPLTITHKQISKAESDLNKSQQIQPSDSISNAIKDITKAIEKEQQPELKK